MDLSRRRLFGFGAALLAAPAIVRIAALMPVKVMPATNVLDTALADGGMSLVEAFQETKENFAAQVLNDNMSVARFRELLMPGLRKAFAGAYDSFDDDFN